MLLKSAADTTADDRQVACVVVGDLSLDAVCSIDDPLTLQELVNDQDVTLDVNSRLTVGGSAWLFTQALMENTQAVPLVLSATGADAAGDFIRSAFRAKALPTRGLLESTTNSTSVCTMTYFMQSQRLMTYPSSIAPKLDSYEQCKRAIDSLKQDYLLSCAWISGHSLVRPSVERASSLSAICDAIRSDGGRIVLDLVPHKFRQSVGDLVVIERALGKIDGFVGEATTFEDLGLAPCPMARSDDVRMKEIAAYVSSHYKLCVVQDKVGAKKYCQAVGHCGSLVDWNETEFATRNLRGLGDEMSVNALLNTMFIS